MAVLSVVPGGVAGSADGFEIGYVTEDGASARIPAAEAWGLALEAAQPARRFTSYKGQRNLPGRWWSATDGRHVGYESWLERDHLLSGVVV